MLLFKRILNFTQNSVAASNKRNSERYTVGEKFPFKASVTLLRHDEFGVPVPNDDVGQDWVGTLNNLSATGASIQLHSAALGSRGQSCCMKLRLDDYLLEIPGTIALLPHLPASHRLWLCLRLRLLRNPKSLHANPRGRRARRFVRSSKS